MVKSSTVKFTNTTFHLFVFWQVPGQQVHMEEPQGVQTLGFLFMHLVGDR